MIILSCLLMVWFGPILMAKTRANDVSALPLTRGMVYRVIPLSGLLMAIFAPHHLAQGEETDGILGSA